MALPSSGTLSLSQIRDEFGGVNPVSMSDYYRGGPYVTTNNTGVPTSGAISINQFYGATAQFSFTISSNYSTPQNLATLATAAGWDGTDYLVVTNSAIISSNTTGTAALTISGSFPNGVLFINNGTIVGMGGRGGGAGSNNAEAGGDAILVSSNVSINNGSGTIAGGGGGGSSSPSFGWCGVVLTTAGGAGASGLTQSLGGASNGVRTGDGYPSSLSGSLYSIPGGYKQDGACGVLNSPSGAGGSWGSAGVNAGWSGGAAGKALSGDSYVTWVATGTRYGAVV